MKSLLNICLALTLFRVSHGVSQRHLEVLQLAHSRASTHARASSRALAGFQKYTDELVDEFLRTGEPADTECQNASVAIKEYIYQEYIDHLESHNIDLNRTDCATKVLECTTAWFSDTNLEHIHNLSLIINYTRDNHSECRQNQATCCNDQACNKYNAYRKFGIAPDWKYIPFPDCYEIDLDPDFIRATEEEKRQTMESCLREVYDWHNPLYEQYLKCKNNVSCCVEPQEACNNMQRNFEVAHCIGHDYLEDHCKGHRTCWEHEEAECSTTCSDVLNGVELRKAENETGERIVCLLDVLLNDTGSGAVKQQLLEDCKKVNYSTTFFDFWDIACPSGGTPEWPSNKLRGYCAEPGFEQITTAVSDSPEFQFSEFQIHLLPQGDRVGPYVGTGDWHGIPQDFFQCLMPCPGHYTNGQTQRNASFWIGTDEDSYKGLTH